MSTFRPTDIRHKDFPIVEGGYDPEQVRAFLSTIATGYEALDEEGDSLPVEDKIASILAEARTEAHATMDVALAHVTEVKRQTTIALSDLRWREQQQCSRTRQLAIERAEQIVRDAEKQGLSRSDSARIMAQTIRERLAILRRELDRTSQISDELDALNSVASSVRNLKTDWTSDGDRIRVLIVCTWNRVRSPIASEILRHEVARLGCKNVDVISRGVQAELGHGPPREVVKCAGRLRIDVSQHRSRRLSRADVVLADLVVVMERRHARLVKELYPWATVVLLADLLNTAVDAAGPSREVFALLAQQTSDQGGREITDPLGSSQRAFDRCVEEMAPALHNLARILTRVESGLQIGHH
jgi:DivIVA domain-containing protein